MLKIFLIVILILNHFLNCTRICNTNCGIKNDAGRIVGGRNVTGIEHPWMCYFTFGNEFICGCTLISDKFVLSAAHCTNSFELLRIENNIIVHFGTDNICTNDIVNKLTRKIDRIYNGNFNSLSLANDISLLKLSKPITFSDNISPITLPTIDRILDNKLAFVTGWGLITENGEQSCILKETEIPILTNDECFSKFQELSIRHSLSDKNICTLYNQRNISPTDACQQDSGGPLIYQRQDKSYEQIGIVSWGLGCARKNSPGIYTKVYLYRNWIEQIVNSQNGCLCQ